MIKVFCCFITLLAVLNAFGGGDDKEVKKSVSQQGLITTISVGDNAPINRYLYIVSYAAIANNPLPSVSIFDSLPEKFFLGTAFCNNCAEKLFRFYKDPYEPFYRIFFDKDHQQCVDVSLSLIDPSYSPFISKINYGWGQNFYVRYNLNGAFKIFHSSGKTLTLNPNERTTPRLMLTEDDFSVYTLWFFVDPTTKKILFPEDF